MRSFIENLYKKYIHPWDPAFFITLYAAKSVFACIASLILPIAAGMPFSLVQWTATGALVVMFGRAGSTLRERKQVSLCIIFISAFFTPVSTWISNTDILLTAYVFIFSFVAFFAAAPGFSWGVVGLIVLVTNLIVIGSPADFITGVYRSFGLITGGLIAYGVNFHFWPVNPEKALRKTGAIALMDLGDFFQMVTENPDSDQWEKSIKGLRERATLSVRRYRQVMETMNIDPMKGLNENKGPTAIYAVLVRVISAVTALERNRRFVEDSVHFQGLKQPFKALAIQSAMSFRKLSQSLTDETPFPGTSSLARASDDLENEFILIVESLQAAPPTDVFLEAWSALYSLRNLTIELDNMTHISP